ncbi:Inositol 2-dehydrogenase [Nymphon striatum]|nr:Inositol 2-dehydrogenase [Nymphon striatum]
MGTSHARAYHQLESFEIVGLVSRKPESRDKLSQELGGYPTFSDYSTALKETKPDAVSINTYPDTHADYIRAALHANAHVFVEKPLALTVADAQSLVDLAIEERQKNGKPLVMRMNLNQQSSGDNWYTHKQLMNSMSPIVDCGVHYVDVMCLMTQSVPISVSAIGARLSDEIDSKMYNYGQLQVRFKDGSVGWYEAGWGPMMSETAFFVKDVIGPKGCVSIIDDAKGDSDSVDDHSKTGALKLHHSTTDGNGNFTKPDELIDTSDEPDHDGLCLLEQEYFLKAIQENLDLQDHMRDAVNSLRIVLAADESFRTGKTVAL